MAYAAVASFLSSYADNDNGLTVAMPSGIVAGDLLIVGLTCASADTVTVPSGWTPQRDNGNFRSYRRTAGSSEPSTYRWGTNNTRSYSAIALRVTGADASDPIPVSSGQVSGGSTSPTAPSVTTPGDEFLLLWFAGWRRANPNVATCTVPSGMTEIDEVTATAGTVNNAGTCVASEQFPTAGATGSRVGTLSASVGNVGQILAIRPASAPPPSTTPKPEAPSLLAARHAARRARADLLARNAPRQASAVGAGAGTGAGHAYGDLPVVTLTAPTAVAAGGADGTALGDLPTLTVAAPSAEATAGASVEGDLPTVTTTAPTAAASGGADGAAVGDLPTLTVAAPSAAATGGANTLGAFPVVLITPPAATASNGAPVTGTGWRLTLRTAGPRWRIAWRPMAPNAPFPVPVSPANDAGVLVDEIAGYQLPSGAPMLYDGASITAHWADAPDSDTPLGSVSNTFPRNASVPRFAVGFEAADMDQALASVAEGAPVWLVLTGAGNFRAAIEHVVRTRTLG